MSFVDLVQGATINLFLLLGFVSLFSMVRGFLTDRSKGVPTVVEGLLFGTMAVVAMMVPSSTAPGIIFDCRAGVIGAGALLGGPLCALAILPLPLLYRFHLGGLGLAPGLLEIILPAILGAACHLFCRVNHHSLTLRSAVLYSLIIGVSSNILIIIFILLFMPHTELLLGTGSRMVVMLMGPASIVLFTVLLVLEKQHLKNETALLRSEEKYRRLIETTGTGYVIIDEEGRVVDANMEYVRLTGRQMLEDLLGRPLSDWTASHDLERMALEIQNCLKQGSIRGLEIECISPAGDTKPIEMNATLLSNSEDLHILSLCRDITDRKKMEFQIIQAQKMESIGILAGGIAHDFNNLLMAIQGRLSLLAFEMSKEKKLSDYQEKIEEVDTYLIRAADLTAKLLGFARKGKIEVVPMNVNQLVSQQTQMFGRTRKEIAITQDLSKNPLVVEMDCRQIEQVLLNIYVNAAQAMPYGGNLHVRTIETTLSEEDVLPYNAAPGAYVKISITDNGTGMDEAVRARVFEPFFTTKEMGHGTGLGLASSFGIIQNHHGFISFESEINKGTTFHVFLPTSRKTPRDEKPAAEEIVTSTGTILLVDDEQMVAEVGAEILSALGYEALVARNGSEALDIYRINQNRIDLVILDMIMPGIRGDEMFDRLRQINPKVKVLLSSGYSIDGQASAIIDKGCNGFIQKPYSMAALSQKISEILEVQKASP